MNTLVQSEHFKKWLSELSDQKGKARVLLRLKRAEHGNLGECKGLGDSVYEMKIDAGPGYRVYYMRDGLTVYLLLTGGDKDSQDSDIKLAKKLALELKQERGK